MKTLPCGCKVDTVQSFLCDEGLRLYNAAVDAWVAYQKNPSRQSCLPYDTAREAYLDHIAGKTLTELDQPRLVFERWLYQHGYYADDACPAKERSVA